MLQNADDAGAKAISIEFKSAPMGAVEKLLKAPVCESIVFKNNGAPFSDSDFSRLLKIAEGNPDEQKIGLFGVGFYSLFSICEEPFISSGDTSMAFFWRDDFLYTKRGIIPQASRSEWVTFYLQCREPQAIPDISTFSKFLVKSLAFSTSINQVNVTVDGNQIIEFQRTSSIPNPIQFNQKIQSPLQYFKLSAVTVAKIQMRIKIISSNKSIDHQLYLRMVSGKLVTNVSKEVKQEMNRITKKNPPETTILRIILSNQDEFEASYRKIYMGTFMFDDVILPPTAHGKIFIGFPTHQTTGCALQIAAQFIPTVERESIDFVDKTLRVWNEELLAISGLFSRMIYEMDIEQISTLYEQLSLDETSTAWMNAKFLHTLNSFTFKQSTPAAHVGLVLAQSFFNNSKPLSIMSSNGIKTIDMVRIPVLGMKEFTKSTSVMSKEVLGNEMIQRLVQSNWVKTQDIHDVILEVQSRVFNADEVISLLRWIFDSLKIRKITLNDVNLIRGSLRFTNEGTEVKMAEMKYFMIPGLVSGTLVLPKDLIPRIITKDLASEDLVRYWNLQELKLKMWIQFVVKLPQFSKDPSFVESVMLNVSRQFKHLPRLEKVEVVSSLGEIPSIVSSMGLLIPSKCYFPSVTLFSNLPKVSFFKPVDDAFLQALGVRETVELQLFFDRLHDLEWNQKQLIQYLSSVQDKLTEVEWARLKTSPLFLTNGTDSRYLASSLYVPRTLFKNIKVNLLSWPQKWKYGSKEGLQTHIPIRTFFQLLAESSHVEGVALLDYFSQQFDLYYRNYDPNLIDIASILNSKGQLCLPSRCFLDSDLELLNFNVLHPDLARYAPILGIKNNPNGEDYTEYLRTMPIGYDRAPEVFSLLSSKLHRITASQLKLLSRLKFIPLRNDKEAKTVYEAPLKVYFSNDEKSFESLFLFIDFGNSANSFLRTCGVRDQPSPIELARNLILSPLNFLQRLGDKKYLDLLRKIATNFPAIKSQLGNEFIQSPFLLATKNYGKDNTLQYQLAKAADIYLIDDTGLAALFNPVAAPIDDLLETMYFDLGSKWLSKQVPKHFTHSGIPSNSESAANLLILLKERESLLYYDGHTRRKQSSMTPSIDKILADIRIFEVNNVQQHFSFGEQVINQKSTCYIDRTLKLYITSEYDYFDVSSAISDLILINPRLNDILLISMLLSSSFENLSRKGFPVDRILSLKKSKILNSIVQKDNDAIEKIESLQSKKSETLEIDALIAELESIFPQVSTKLIVDLVKKMWPKESYLIVEEILLLESEGNLPKPIDTKPMMSGFFGAINSFIQNFPTAAGDKVSQEVPGSFPSAGIEPQAYDEKVYPAGTITRNENITYDFENRIPQQLQISEGRLRALLKSCVSQSRPAHDSSIEGLINPEDSLISKPTQTNFCRSKLVTDLQLSSTIEGVPFYIDKRVIAEGMVVMQTQISALARFTQIIISIAEIFGCPLKALHIYWDIDGSTIAFNRNCSLFFNLRFYLALHFRGRDQKESANCYFYWFMTFAHELAHNLVSEHNADHEHYMSAFAENYLGLLVKKLLEIGMDFVAKSHE